MAETAVWSEYFITNAGRNLRQAGIAEGKEIVFTRAVIGTGKPADPDQIDDMTGLVAYAKDVVIKKSYALEANHLHIVRVDNSGYLQDVLMTELGVFAKYNDQADAEAILYGYAYNRSGYVLIPAQTSDTNRKIYEVTLDSYLSLTAKVSIVYDSSSIFVSHVDMDDFINNLNAGQISYLNAALPESTTVQTGMDYLVSAVGSLNETKVDKDKAFLSTAKRAKDNDLFQSALAGELGLLQIAPIGAGDAATQNAPPGFGWGVCFAAQYGGTHQLLAIDDQGQFAFCGRNGIEWSKWQVFFQETKPITLINGWKSIEAVAVCEASKFGNRVTLTLSIINSAGSSGGTIAYLPWKTKKLTIVQTGTNFLIWLAGNILYSSGDIAANKYVTLNMSYETEE